MKLLTDIALTLVAALACIFLFFLIVFTGDKSGGPT
jgi:hypothetical protein